MATVMTAPTNGMVLRFISTVMNSIVMVVIAPTVAEVEIQLELVALVKVVQLAQKLIAMLQVVHILAMARHVVETLAVAVATVKQVGQKTVKARASLTMSLNRGLVTRFVMMVLMFLPITDAPNAQQGLQSG
jgi:hypothetical protein